MTLTLTNDQIEICIRLCASLFVGSLIGLERNFHGRPAGFRTHALVCMASAMLMLAAVYQNDWFPAVNAPPSGEYSRIAQGIVSGIGFLGAGVIMREGLTVHGLTTAASVWMTAAMGILIGIGLYFPVGIATVLAVVTLAAFRRIESKMPSLSHIHFTVRFARDSSIQESDLRDLVLKCGFRVVSVSQSLKDSGSIFEYRMVLRTFRIFRINDLSAALLRMPSVQEFNITPAGD